LRRFTRDIRLVMAAYGLLLLVAVLALPLRIEELLQLLASRQGSISGFLMWIPKAPGSAPLSYFVQFPFVFAMGVSRLGVRLPSLLFALGSCFLFLRLAKTVQIRSSYIALAVFLLLPAHYRLATDGRPFEQALFLLLLATLFFLRLLRTPTLETVLWYGGALTLCLYTARLSYLPAIGYLLFLFAFVNRAHERRVIWYALPATAIPVLLFIPYFLWARPLVSPDWLTEPAGPGTPSSVYLQALENFAGGGLLGYALSVLLLVGLFVGAWGLFRLSPPGMPARITPPRSIAIFSLFGGAVGTLAAVLVIDVWNRYPFHGSQALGAVPGAIISMAEAIERLAPRQKRVLWGSLIVLCLLADVRYVLTTTEDLRSETALVRPLLRGDSCVVFVSERLSKNLFLLFDPGLESRECGNFFHRRAVLASHADVTGFQQEDAESFFRGLNFIEVKRIRAGGGQIVVMETRE
jgi:hypothetical protein